ncbi:MAG: outer membrane beta-barrel protein [Gemmatimonadales bacterium]
MRSRLTQLALATAASLIVGPTLQAQVLGLPLRNSGIPSGVGISGEIGFPNTDYGKGTAFGGTGQIGLGPIGFTATIASYKPKGGGSTTGYGGTGNLKIFGGPLIPLSVTLQGGYGRAKTGGVTNSHFTAGLGIALNIPNPALAIRPWLAPRLDVARVSGPTPTRTDNNFGISGGVDFNLLSGLGFRASYDWVKARSNVKPAIFGLGVAYVFKVPGL